MITLDRYLLATCLRYQLAMFSGFSLLKIGQEIIATLSTLPNIQLSQLGYLVLLLIPSALNSIAPASLALSILLTGNQLYSQNEIYILKNSGWSPRRIAFPLFFAALMTGAVMTLNASYIKPIATVKLSTLIFDINNANFTEYLVPGEFRHLDSLSMSVKANDRDGDVLKDVFIHHEPSEQIITGKQAYIQNNGFFEYDLFILNGSVLQVKNDESTLINFEAYSTSLPRPPLKLRNSISYKTVNELKESSSKYEQTEYYWRLTLIFHCLAIAGISLLLIPKNPRGGTSTALLIGIITYFVFNELARDAFHFTYKNNANPTTIFLYFYALTYAASFSIIFMLKKIKNAL